MTPARRYIICALAFNIVVLVPVVSVLLLGFSQADQGFGQVTPARLILTSVYISIALVSGALIFMHVQNFAWAVPMSVALFMVQIIYKLITVPLVGLTNPVAISNLVVVCVQLLALSVLWRTRTKGAAHR